MTDYDAIQSRLRSLASAPVDDAVAERHLSALADAGVVTVGPTRRGRYLVMGAVVAGTFVGSATLAGAVSGSLPGPAQDAAHTALAKVGIEVPKAKDKGKPAKADDTDGPGSVERFLGDATTPCTLPDGSAFVGNHGQYVKGHPDDPATADVNERQVAAESRCGKPVQAGAEDSDAVETDADNGKKPEDTGKPESPGKSEEHKPADADDTGKPESPGKSDEHKPADAGKPTTEED